MDVKRYSSDCKLVQRNKTWTGMAHIIEVEYSDRIRFCNFVMQITTDQLVPDPNSKNADLMDQGGLELEDGRKACVTVSAGRMSSGYFELSGAGQFFNT
jgi:hypothetical protein